MSTWYKLAEKTPEFNKEVIVRTKNKHKNVNYAIVSLASIVSSVAGIEYNWNTGIIDDFKMYYGEVFEWCEIPK